MPATFTRRAFAIGAAAIPAAPAIARTASRVQTGLDRLIAGEGRDNRGEKIALLTHSGARDALGQRSVDAIAAVPGIKLVGLLSPEHGLDGRAAAGEAVADRHDATSGLPIHSLYGKDRRAPEALLRQVDTIMVDLQDVGLRPFTYAATMIEAIQLAQSHGLRVFVLDRPNPMGGLKVDGPMVADDLVSHVSALPTPFRHGLTMLEIAALAVTKQKLTIQTSGLAVTGWRRSMGTEVFGSDGLPFTPPSPNLRSPAAVLAYAATVLIEGTNLSEGRGTSHPFQLIGAPWCNGPALAKAMTALDLPGVRFAPASFTPKASKYAGKRCEGLRFTVVGAQDYDPLQTGLSIIAAVQRLHPKEFAFLAGKRPFFDLLIGQGWVRDALVRGEAPAAIAQRWQGDVQRFRSTATYLPSYG